MMIEVRGLALVGEVVVIQIVLIKKLHSKQTIEEVVTVIVKVGIIKLN